jgi:hypothetical protein
LGKRRERKRKRVWGIVEKEGIHTWSLFFFSSPLPEKVGAKRVE